MDKLPVEILDAVLDHLAIRDKRTLRLVSQSINNIATPRVFEKLSLCDNGDGSMPLYDLEKILKELSTIISCVKTLKLGLAYYYQDDWTEYDHAKQYKENLSNESWSALKDKLRQIEKTAEEYNNNSDDDIDKGREDCEDELDTAQNTNTQLKLLRSQLEWERRVQKQADGAEAVNATFRALVLGAPALQNVQISCKGNFRFAQLALKAEDLKVVRARGVIEQLEYLGTGLEYAQRHLLKLSLLDFESHQLRDCPATRHAFSHLVHLELRFLTHAQFREEGEYKPDYFNLFTAVASSLETLNITALSCQPESQLLVLWHLFAPHQNAAEEEYISFPRLTCLTLRSLLVTGESVRMFLKRQGRLEELSTGYMYLADDDVTWLDIGLDLSTTLDRWETFELFTLYRFEYCHGLRLDRYSPWYFQREPVPGWMSVAEPMECCQLRRIRPGDDEQ